MQNLILQCTKLEQNIRLYKIDIQIRNNQEEWGIISCINFPCEKNKKM